MFYEIKSVRRGQKVVLYHWRIEKEKNHIWVQRRKLRYAILVHPVTSAKSVAEYLHQLEFGPVRILNCAGGLVHDLAEHCPLVKPKVREDQPKRFGMTRGGYADGYYNLPVGQLMENTEPVAQFIVPFFNRMIPVELRVS